MILLFYILLIDAIIGIIASIYGKILLKEKGYVVNWIIFMPITEYINLKKIANKDRRHIPLYYLIITTTIIYYLVLLLIAIFLIFFRDQLQF